MNKQARQGAPQCGVSQQSPTAAATNSFAKAVAPQSYSSYAKKAAAVIA